MSAPRQPADRDALPEDLLSAYVDGELDVSERAAVEARLAQSPEWRAVLAELSETRAMVRALPGREAPPGFWDHVLVDGANVVDLGAARRRRTGRGRRWVAAVGGAAAAAAAIVGVAIVPAEQRVQPDVAIFTKAHAVRSSLADDVVSNVAGATVSSETDR